MKNKIKLVLINFYNFLSHQMEEKEAFQWSDSKIKLWLIRNRFTELELCKSKWTLIPEFTCRASHFTTPLLS